MAQRTQTEDNRLGAVSRSNKKGRPDKKRYMYIHMAEQTQEEDNSLGLVEEYTLTKLANYR